MTKLKNEIEDLVLDGNNHNPMVLKRKILVLDLDETLIHSRHAGRKNQTRYKTDIKPDFVLNVS